MLVSAKICPLCREAGLNQVKGSAGTLCPECGVVHEGHYEGSQKEAARDMVANIESRIEWLAKDTEEKIRRMMELMVALRSEFNISQK